MTSTFTAFRIHSEGGRIAARFEPVTLDELAPGEVGEITLLTPA